MGKVLLARTSNIVRHQKHVDKVCVEAGCGKKFKGHPVRKYCDYHRYPKNRSRSRPIHDNVTDNNRIIKHSYTESCEVEIKCMHDGCKNYFKVTLNSKVFTYPKYCEYHRPKHRREES